MKVAVLLSLALLAAARPSSGQIFQHEISLYADPSHTTTDGYDLAPGVLSVFVVHETTPAASSGVSSGFRIVSSPGFTGVWLSETPLYFFEGTTPGGIALSYGACVQLPTRLVEVRYTVFGTSAECSYLEVGAHPEHGLVAIDCDFELIPATGGKLSINPNPTCPPVPVESTTWGKVKSLYR